MCGIVGYVGTRPAVEVLIRGLKRLEYRGYDSAGVSYLIDSHFETRKSEGKLENVERILGEETARVKTSHCGIGHTRWATHGKPTTQNAHPHKTGHVVLVHNGIIENYDAIKSEIKKLGHHPQSETDSELFGYLVLDEMERGTSLKEAVRKSFQKLEGQSSVVVMSEREPGVIIGLRNGSPLVAGVDSKGGSVLASDAQPLLEYTKDVYFLETGEGAQATSQGLQFFNIQTGQDIKKRSERLDWTAEKLDKQGFAHYMLKEIYEQPSTLIDTLNGLLDRAKADPFRLADQPGVRILKSARELVLVACGTSWHAALLGKYWLEQFAKIPVSVELSSEFRYREPVLRSGAVVVGLSQSGETADTLAVLREMRSKKIPTLGITNVRGSSISREADAVFYTSSGPEIGVAATKTFMAQMLTLLLFAGSLGLSHDEKGLTLVFHELIKLPHLLQDYLKPGGELSRSLKSLARELQSVNGFFFMGRGYSFPMALEGALKLKEIAYLHAEGYAAGELKHGPIAMIDQNMAVVVLAPRDAWRNKTVSNLEEVKARGARILAVGDAEDGALKKLSDFWIPLPEAASALRESLQPFLLAPVVQLLSYEIALLKGTDVDKPRNLAKSVTVE